MDYFDSLKQRLAKANRYAQVALAAECASRVYPVYQTYCTDDPEESVKQSIELGWTYAQGNKIDKNQFQVYLTEVQDIVDYYNEEDISELASTVTVVLRILEAVDGTEEDTLMAATRSLTSTMDAALFTQTMVNQHVPTEPKVKGAAEYEEAWQEAALEIVDGWSDFATKDMFESIREKEMQPWLKECITRYNYE